MTMTTSDAELLRSGYDAFAAGDVPAVLALFDEDITWHIAGHSPVSGDYTGHDEVVGFFQALGERSTGTFGLDVHRILDGGEGTVVALVTENAQRNGARLNAPAVHVWRVQDGKASSFHAYRHDDYVLDDFWS
jgi:ketosteroid isomerase-like protein